MTQNTNPQGKPYSVLIVDDEPDLIGWLTMLLENKGFKTYAAVDAFTALYYCRKYKPDLMILDLNLGHRKMDGTEVLWTLKNDPAISSTVVLVFTGNKDEQVRKLCMDDLGADGFLVKGEAHRLDLAGTIQDWLRLIQIPSSKTELVSGPLHINLAQSIATVDGKPVPLTPREFNLLTYLAHKSPNLTPWETLAKKLWTKPQGPYLVDEPELIEACVTHARFKLGREAGKHLITVPKTGALWTGKSFIAD